MKICGIYKITNLVNGRIYIGSSANGVERRLWRHFRQLKINIHCNKKLQRAYNKYGEKNFVSEIIEQCSKDVLIQREQYWIDTLNPFYNICKIAGSSLGRVHTPESLEKMRTFQQNYFLTHPAPNKGKKFSIESRQKMSIAKKGKQTWNKGVTHSPETRKKLSACNLGARSWRARSIIQKTLDGKMIQAWPCVSEAARILGVPKGGIFAVLRGLQKKSHGFMWEYNKKSLLI